jgi:hypothetical protein
MFTFHVRNAGEEALAWSLGCQRNLPIWLHLPEGDLPTGPGAVDICEFTCDRIYAGTSLPGGCTDCGGGYSGRAAPGASADIVWDRRVYTSHTYDPACFPSTVPPMSTTCALGRAIAPSATQSGTITVCPGEIMLSNCREPGTGRPIESRKVEFTVDTTGTEAVIEVR